MTQPVWNTSSGTLGTFLALTNTSYQLVGSPTSPATSITFSLLSGSLPQGLSLSSTGLISGTPALVTTDALSTFAVRITDNLGNIRDRTFSMTISGSASPAFTTPDGSLLTTNDSVWVELQLEYLNPNPDNQVTISLYSGSLPPGLELSDTGMLRGYPLPPTLNITVPTVDTVAIATSAGTNQITCLSTTGFEVGRPIIFSGSVFGNVSANVTYYVKTIVNSTTFTVSTLSGGSALVLTSGSGAMAITLPPTSIGEPTIKTYSFAVRIQSLMGNDVGNYSLTVVNQNTPIIQGGPGNPVNTRHPAILNTRPRHLQLTNADPYYGYYLLPESGYATYPLSDYAYAGVAQSNNFYAFKIIGYDFDSTDLNYEFSSLPLGLVGDPLTGWITGTPTLSSDGINQYTFSAAVFKTSNPTIKSDYVNFSFDVANNLIGDITWVSSASLGTILNGTISSKYVRATSDVQLEYRLVSGSLPPNLILLSNGEIAGCVADQPTTELLDKDDTTDFVFTVEAFSQLYPGIKSTKTFTLNVLQAYDQPTDTLYIKAAPSLPDRSLIDSLLTDETLIPVNMLYRPDDVYFGKATAVVYEHAFGIYASDIDEYLTAITRNHYWRNITLGELKTAVAKDENGNPLYEVVYSQVIDNLNNLNGTSIKNSIYWPRTINLNLGPWYTSITDIFTSYDSIQGQDYYTSLSPGSVRTLYPNSLQNMRERIANVIGQEYDSRLLPLWMTSPQDNGSTLGYTAAWVICYTKPGFAETIKNNINNNWKSPEGFNYKLNKINFRIDRFSVNKSITYNYDKNTVPPVWTGLPSGTPVPNPLDSKDFYVLFPRQTILPNESE